MDISWCPRKLLKRGQTLFDIKQSLKIKFWWIGEYVQTVGDHIATFERMPIIFHFNPLCLTISLSSCYTEQVHVNSAPLVDIKTKGQDTDISPQIASHVCKQKHSDAATKLFRIQISPK